MKHGVRHTCIDTLQEGWWLEGMGMAMMTLKSSESAMGIVFNTAVSFEVGMICSFTEFEGLLKVTQGKAKKVDLVVNATLDSIHRS